MSHTNPEASDLPRAVDLDLTKTRSISGRARPPLALIDSSTGKRLGPRAVNNQAGAAASACGACNSPRSTSTSPCLPHVT